MCFLSDLSNLQAFWGIIFLMGRSGEPPGELGSKAVDAIIRPTPGRQPSVQRDDLMPMVHLAQVSVADAKLAAPV